MIKSMINISVSQSAMPAHSKREHILNTAMKLFYLGGFNATGVDKIIARAGVSKKTLYNHFKTKNELILATLRKRDEITRNHMMKEVDRLASSPREKLLVAFDVLHKWINSEDYSGCMFINASAEFSEEGNPCYEFCAEHKSLTCKYLQKIAQEAGAKHPQELAKQIKLIMEGATVCAHVMKDKNAALRAKEIAQTVLAHNLP